jgi:cyclic beta-1,2-glucan synthetase
MTESTGTPDAIEERARELATRLSVHRHPGRPRKFRRRIARLRSELRVVIERLLAAHESRTAIAAEWLLDNEYLVLRAVDQLDGDLPAGYYRLLPKIRVGAQERSRVELLARESLAVSEGFVDVPRIQRFVRSFQIVTALDIGEIWALPAFLRLVVVEEVVAAAKAAAEAESDANERMAAAVGSLRVLNAAEWREFFESVSIVDRHLRLDPHDAYARLDFATRDRYRSALEEMARQSGLPEAKVARFAVAAVRESGQPLGALFIGRERGAFETRLGCHVRARTRIARFLRRHAGFWYFGGVALGFVGALLLIVYPVAFASSSVPPLGFLAAILLGCVPASAVAIAVANQVATRAVAPRRLPRLDFSRGIPDDARTLVAIPALLSDPDEIAALIRQLELNRRGNESPNLSFALLADLVDADRRECPEDADLVASAAQGVQDLNERHRADRGHLPFLLLTRERKWNCVEGRWMAWERKRGKLRQLNRLLLGDRSSGLRLVEGDPQALEGVRYVLTLDADTFLPEGTAARLAATLAHPMNVPRFDARGRVVDGYTVLQPRIEILANSLRRTWFSRVYRARDGLDLYSNAASDVYQDLFGEGIYAGKGIYDVEGFERSLAGRAPENALLSHDLFEGVHGRAALVSDISVVEDYPSHPAAYMRRLHRWVRGDWQILPWLFPRVPSEQGERIANPLSLLDRWKIFDNLRRSLLAVSLVLLTAVGWWWLPGGAWWTAVPLLAVGVPVLLPEMASAVTRWKSPRGEGVFRTSLDRLGWSAARALTGVVFLPWQAIIEVDAIVRTLFRLIVSRRHLLQWTSAAATARSVVAARGGRSRVRDWIPIWAAPLSIGAGGALVGGFTWATQAPLLVAWLLAPLLAEALARDSRGRRLALTEHELRDLRMLARRTWAYFDRLVSAEDHWLPPDNLQLHPIYAVARRTSPTNIGLGMLAHLVGSDLGFMPPSRVTAVLASTLDTLDRLERHRGHLLNWYDTRHLRPLLPRYVSTVDSGNLAACAVAVGEGLRELPALPLTSSRFADGIVDGLEILAETLETFRTVQAFRPHNLPADIRAVAAEMRAARHDGRVFAQRLAALTQVGLPTLETQIAHALESRRSEADPSLGAVREWVRGLDRQAQAIHEELELLVPWLGALRDPPMPVVEAPDPELEEALQAVAEAARVAPTLAEVPATCGMLATRLAALERVAAARGDDARAAEVRRWALSLASRLHAARRAAEGLLQEMERVASRLDALMHGMDFEFLYDPSRKLMRVGYHADAAALDRSYYDLYASEARLASFIAIAKGDVPAEHWTHLGRPFARRDGTVVLLSWAGTMFEYLMPGLFLRTFPGSIADLASRRAVELQVRHARKLRVPCWGTSESGFHQTDAQNLYRYRAFGVGALGVRWDVTRRIVSAPYASVLALGIDPRAAVNNLHRLEELGASGTLGFYEAADFGPPGGLRRPQIVRSFMAHHQGMILAALDNFLLDSAIVERFHRDSRMAAGEYLLHEAAPGLVRLGTAPTLPRLPAARAGLSLPPTLQRRNVDPEAFPPPTTVVSNAALSTLLTAAGGGGLRWRGRDILRWRPDPTVQDWGLWIYVRDVESKRLWSATLAPTWVTPKRYRAAFGADVVEFHRYDHGIAMRTAVTVPTTSDVEIRRVTLVNESRRARTLELTSYAEVALSDPGEDRRHPAFAKLFVEGRYASRARALMLERRPRGEESATHLVHAVVRSDSDDEALAWSIDRHAFLGRRGTLRRPRGVTTPSSTMPADAAWAPLDPIVSLTTRVTVPPGEEVTVAFLSAVAESPGAALAHLDAYRSPGRDQFAAQQARDRERALLHELSLEGDSLPALQRLLTAIAYPYHTLRPRGTPSAAASTSVQETLWTVGVSGDVPVVMVETDAEHDRLLTDLVRAQVYWERHGTRFDLVAVSSGADGYQQPLLTHLERLLASLGVSDRLGRRGGVHHVSFGRMSEAGLAALRTGAAVSFVEDGRSLGEHLRQLEPPEPEAPPFVPARFHGEPEDEITPLTRPTDLAFDNGVGGFSPDGTAYAVHLEPGESPPAPWSNVIAHERFGFLVSESGGGFTWLENSGEKRLTTWRNDPVADVPSEVLYLRDEETGHVWSATPSPAPAPAAYQVVHRRGATTFLHRSHGLDHRLDMFVPRDESVKVVELKLTNEWTRPRRLTATYFAEWVLEAQRWTSGPHVSTEVWRSDHAILARNPFSQTAGGMIAFLGASEPIHGFTCDRTEFLGQEGDFSRPVGLLRIGLEGRLGAALDPCAALQVHVDLAPRETRRIRFLLGADTTADGVRDSLSRLRDPGLAPQPALAAVEAWSGLLERIKVKTPERSMDLLLNGWLLYQAVSCRLWGRSGLYQSSGAFGFRDQLQDSLALLGAAPELTREQILEAARHQFPEGDVLHWWHPETDRGVRTRCSDDLLWLPFAVTEYVDATGDLGILDTSVPFLDGPPLGPDEHERYEKFDSRGTAPLYEHCLAALERGRTRSDRGLPLIGSGDWNDALNRVGIAGRGESVWLAWFLYAVQTRFARLCERRGDVERAARLRADAEQLRCAVEAHGWDGAWYLRAIFDDGTPIGTSAATECRIDSLTQSWAVLSGGADTERARTAMRSVSEHLVQRDDRLVLLLTPPFHDSQPDPGYIRAYPPGVRENGGQYTHAATWVGLAFAAMGDGDGAEEIFRLLNPILHAAGPDSARLYRVEPYVTAGDVYGAPPHTGRGGWTWYTGSAGWLYRLGMEGILGLRPAPGGLEINPCIPHLWPGYEAIVRVGPRTRYKVVVRNPERVSSGVHSVRLDGRPLDGSWLQLDDDAREHEVEVVLGPGGAGAGAGAGADEASLDAEAE